MSSKSSLLALISYLELGKQYTIPPCCLKKTNPNLTYFPPLSMEIVLLPKLLYSCSMLPLLTHPPPKKLMVVLSILRGTAIYYYTWNTGHSISFLVFLRAPGINCFSSCSIIRCLDQNSTTPLTYHWKPWLLSNPRSVT